MQITIDNQRFRVDEDGERLVIYDAHDVVIGYATDEVGATAICEQIAWRRRVDGKVDEKPIAVDEELTKDAGVDEKQNVVGECKCRECYYFFEGTEDTRLIGECGNADNGFVYCAADYTCPNAERRVASVD